MTGEAVGSFEFSGKACPDCGVEPGSKHNSNCDVARCLNHGHQRLFCDCGKCGDDVWTGEWPGIAECREYGWYARMGSNGWEPCGKDDEGAHEDLNRLAVSCIWNKKKRRWEKR